MKGGGLISEGGYGCVFLPYVTCKGKTTKNFDYISKIEVKNFSSDNEIKIGKIIKQIPRFYYYFVPAIYHCDINISEFKNTDIDKCRLFKRSSANSTPFILLKMPFIGYKKQIISYSDYIVQKLNDRELLLNLIDSYQHLLFSVELLVNNAICHFDLNENNILFSQTRNTPLIIDFGLSIPMKTLNAENYSNYFYIYIPEYYYWPLEVHYINFLLHESSEPTYQDMVTMAQRYMKENTPLIQNFSKSFLQKFETACVEILDDYRLKSLQIEDLLIFWKSWDNYALSIMYLRILFYLNITEDGVAYTENTFVSAFTTILLQNIHPNASRRLTIQDTRDKFSTFFYNPAVNKVGNYENILENLSENKKRLRRVVLEDKKELLKLEKRYTKRDK